jgi:hypothetical protein
MPVLGTVGEFWLLFVGRGHSLGKGQGSGEVCTCRAVLVEQGRR